VFWPSSEVVGEAQQGGAIQLWREGQVCTVLGRRCRHRQSEPACARWRAVRRRPRFLDSCGVENGRVRFLRDAGLRMLHARRAQRALVSASVRREDLQPADAIVGTVTVPLSEVAAASDRAQI
jgi:hypothetical protein